MTLILTRFYGLRQDMPEDSLAARGPYRDEHREDPATFQQAEDLWTWLAVREARNLLVPLSPSVTASGPVVDSQHDKPVEPGLWVHKKGSLYTASGDCYYGAGSALLEPGIRAEYVSLDNELRPGTRWSLREISNFRGRFVYLGPGFPVPWTEPLLDRVCQHLGLMGLEKLFTYADPKKYLTPLTD